jgi:hypothetical protein
MTDPRFLLDVPFAGRVVPVVLRLAKWGEIAGVSQEPLGAPASRLEMQYEVGVLRSIAAVDGKALFGERAKAFMADVQAVTPVLKRRYEIYEQVRSAGQLFARCPRCREGEVELTLLGLFNTVGKLPPYAISADFLYFRPPILGYDVGAPRRPAGVEYAAGLRFELPTKALGFEREGPGAGVLVPADPVIEEHMFQRWATDGVNAPVGRAWWRRGNAAFRATVKLATAIPDFVPATEWTPETFEQLAAVDVYFLDALYWYTHVVDVPDHAPPRTCSHCGARFLPVTPPLS